MDGDYPYMDFEDEEYMDGDYYSDNYYDEDPYNYEDMYEEVYQRISLSELNDKCLIPTLSQAFGAIMPLIVICFISRLIHLLNSDENSESSVFRIFLHLSSAVCGLIAAHIFFETSVIYLVILALVPYLQLRVTVHNLRGTCGPMTAGLVVAYVLACELAIVESEEWHKIRGSQMVIAMKVISLGFDLDQNQVPEVPNIFQYFGYVFHPGSVIFGPWVSFQEYNTLQNAKRKKLDAYWFLKVVKSLLLAFLCVLHSTCTVHWLILDYWGRWYLAYRDAQGFRFSHYFVSYVSEATATLSGLVTPASKQVMSNSHKNNGGHQPPKPINGDVRWDITVTKPLHIELPRSITEVVSNWNIPMHYWLRNYIFRPSQHLGNFAAILLTYAASAMLHGLNFQLAAVLLSLGFYSYIEHELRKKLARIFDACIGAKRCKEGCDHEYKYMHPAVIVTNLCFGLLAVFHLAYLGLMFDSSEGQEEGYTMSHTLSKWRGLDYASHWVALGTLVIYLLI